MCWWGDDPVLDLHLELELVSDPCRIFCPCLETPDGCFKFGYDDRAGIVSDIVQEVLPNLKGVSLQFLFGEPNRAWRFLTGTMARALQNGKRITLVVFDT